MTVKNLRAASLAFDAWLAYDAALTLLAHHEGVGWRGQIEPKLDRLYETALLFTRIATGLPLGALGEGELSPTEISALCAEAGS